MTNRERWRLMCIVLLACGLLCGTGCYSELAEPPELAAQARMHMVCSALVAFHEDHRRGPTESEGLDALVFRDANGEKIAYLIKPELLLDPYGRRFVYIPPDRNGVARLETAAWEGTTEAPRLECDLNAERNSSEHG